MGFQRESVRPLSARDLEAVSVKQESMHCKDSIGFSERMVQWLVMSRFDQRLPID